MESYQIDIGGQKHWYERCTQEELFQHRKSCFAQDQGWVQERTMHGRMIGCYRPIAQLVQSGWWEFKGQSVPAYKMRGELAHPIEPTQAVRTHIAVQQKLVDELEAI